MALILAFLIGWCSGVTVTRHDVMDKVLMTFPGRTCDYCDGYAASLDCSDIGDDIWAYLPSDKGTLVVLLRVADCAGPDFNHTTLLDRYPDYYGDISNDVWRKAKLPNAPAKAFVCEP